MATLIQYIFKVSLNIFSLIYIILYNIEFFFKFFCFKNVATVFQYI